MYGTLYSVQSCTKRRKTFAWSAGLVLRRGLAILLLGRVCQLPGLAGEVSLCTKRGDSDRLLILRLAVKQGRMKADFSL